MNSGQDDRLAEVTRDLHTVLERRLGDLLGQVEAARALALHAQRASEDVARRHAIAERLRGDGHVEHAEIVERELEAIEALHADAVEDLAALVGTLHG